MVLERLDLNIATCLKQAAAFIIAIGEREISKFQALKESIL